LPYRLWVQNSCPPSCPALPPKKFLGSFNKEFIEKRQQELANWLHLLCQFDPASGKPDPRTSELFKEFMLTNVGCHF